MSGHPVDAARAAPRPTGSRDPVQRWRLVVAREAGVGDQTQRGQLAAWESALRGCGLPVAGLDGSPPKPRFALAAPLAAAIPGEAELVDVWLVERRPRWQVREVLAKRLPPGHLLVDVFDAWLGEAPLPGQVVASVYRAELGESEGDPATLRAMALALLAASELPRRRRKGEDTVAYDLRPFVDWVTVGRSGDGRTVVRMQLRHDPERGIGRPDELIAELGERRSRPLAVRSLVRERVVLANEQVAPIRDAGTPPADDSDEGRRA